MVKLRLTSRILGVGCTLLVFLFYLLFAPSSTPTKKLPLSISYRRKAGLSQFQEAYSSPHKWMFDEPHQEIFAPGPTIRHPKVSIGMRRILKPPPIPITTSFPTTDGFALNGPFLQSWDHALEQLSTAAISGVESTFTKDVNSEQSQMYEINGIPGTNITTSSEASQLQGYLDCVTSQGEWVYELKGITTHWEQPNAAGPGGTTSTARRLTVHKQDPALAKCDAKFYRHRSPNPDTLHDWDVRDSLKFRFSPKEACKSLLPEHLLVKGGTTPLLDRTQLCRLIRHKNILIAGDAASAYVLHDLLLDWTLEKPATCYGNLYCNMHALCQGGLREGGRVDDGSWHRDEHLFNKLPDPPNAWDTLKRRDNVDDPSNRFDVVEEASKEDAVENAKRAFSPKDQPHPFGTLLRYRRSDGLYMSPHPRDNEHSATYINPATGLREINNYALADARRSDVVIVGKSPLPLPSSNSKSQGSMSYWTDQLNQGVWAGEEKAALVVKAAEALTLDVWLPELLKSLAQLRRSGSGSAPDQLLVWKSSWRLQGECSMPKASLDTIDEEPDHRSGFDWLGWWNSTGEGNAPPHRKQPNLYRLVHSGYPSGTLTDMHTLFYNIQTILQNHIVRTYIAPRIGMVYLDLETPMSMWRSGFVGDDGDCLRPCLPSPGFALEDAFLGNLETVFAWGWDGEGRKNNWLGESFIPYREREKIRRLERDAHLAEQIRLGLVTPEPQEHALGTEEEGEGQKEAPVNLQF